MAKEFIVMRGLPASGKTSEAKDMVKKHPNQYKIVCRDDLRAMIDNHNWHTDKFSKDKERLIKKLRDVLIIEILKDGKSVISCDMNLSQKNIEHFKQLISKFNKDNNDNVKITEKSFFDVPLEVCIKRDLARPNSVGEKVIRQAYRDFIEPKQDFRPLEQNPSLEKIIICDIDNTVAHMVDRSPYDWKRVGEDLPKTPVINIIKLLSTKYRIFFFSGRDSVCRNETIDWIYKHFGWAENEYRLFMRPGCDNRKDSIVKEELFNTYVKDKFFVEGVFDDRLQVCRIWHKLGVQLFRVGDPDADF